MGSKLATAIGIALLFLCVLVFLPCHYAVNDDIAIALDLQDGFDTSFFGLALGRLLSWLYAHVGRSLPWYTAALMLAHAAGLFAFLSALSASRRFRYLWPFFLAFYLTVYLSFLLRVNYTSAAMMAGIQSVLAFLVRLGQPRPSGRLAAILGVLFAYSYLIRRHSWLVIVLFVLPLVLVEVVPHRRRWRLLGAFVAPALVAIAVQSALVRWTVTREYREFSELAELMHRPGFFMPSVPLPDGVLEANGWSALDYELLKSWFFADETKFNRETFRRVADASSAALLRSWRSHLTSAPAALMPGLTAFGAILVVLLAAAFAATRLGTAVFLSCYVAYCLAGMVGLVAFFYLPVHVGTPLWLLVVGVLVGAVFTLDAAARTSERGCVIATAVAALALGCAGVSQAAELRSAIASDTDYQAGLEADLATLNARHSGAVVVWVCCGMDLEYWDATKAVESKFTLIVSGWPTFSPRYRQVLRQRLAAGEATQLLTAMLQSKWAFLVSSSDSARRLTRYVNESLHLDAAFVPVESLGRGELYQLCYEPLSRCGGGTNYTPGPV